MPQDCLKVYEGPRMPQRDEWAAAIALSTSIFVGESLSLEQAAQQWPMIMLPDTRRNTFAMFRDGQPVALIARLEREIRVHGHRLRMGFVGSVCTHAEHRGKGLASTILDATMHRFHQSQVDIVHISGTRPLYFGAGADHIGMATRFTLDKSCLPQGLPPVHIREASEEDAGLLVALAQHEGVRFVRPRIDYELALRSRHCAGREAHFQVVMLGSTVVGYVIACPGDDGSAEVIEFAGDRLCVFAALTSLVPVPYERLVVDVPHRDPLIDLLRGAGVEECLLQSGGTFKVLDFCQLMEKLVPYFKECLPGWHDSELQAAVGKERYFAQMDDGSLQIDGEKEMLWTLLGTPPDSRVESLYTTGTMRELVARCLPLPLPPPYLNMI